MGTEKVSTYTMGNSVARGIMAGKDVIYLRAKWPSVTTSKLKGMSVLGDPITMYL